MTKQNKEFEKWFLEYLKKEFKGVRSSEEARSREEQIYDFVDMHRVEMLEAFSAGSLSTAKEIFEELDKIAYEISVNREGKKVEGKFLPPKYYQFLKSKYLCDNK